MKVLVTAASKYGATKGIAQAIADGLESHGLEARVISPQAVETVHPYDAVVIGSAVYAGNWMKEAKEFIERHRDALAARPVWLFSSGPVGDPPKPEDAPNVAALIEATGAREHVIFAGVLERKRLNFAERLMVKAVRAPDGDFRDWSHIRTWAASIANALTGDAVASR